jgi:hypothetical protein
MEAVRAIAFYPNNSMDMVGHYNKFIQFNIGKYIQDRMPRRFNG